MTDKTAILICGAFNPPTIAHIQMGKALLNTFHSADIIYVPSRDEYITGWKGQFNPIPFYERFALLCGSVINSNRIFVSGVEQHKVKTGKTYDIVNWFKQNYKDVMICVGEDKLDEIPKWYKGNELLKMCHFIIFPRYSTTTIDTLLNFQERCDGRCSVVKYKFPLVSSTKIREFYKIGNLNAIRSDIPEFVYDYLKSHDNLFKESDNNV